MTPELLTGIGAFLTTSITVYISLRTYLSAANKTEMARQGRRLSRVEKKLDREVLYRIKLLNYIGELHRMMKAAGLEVPPLPEQEPEPEPEEKDEADES